jgi:NAD(P)-dependent dehydrogenase (short-subunit alcohol dehydrogenase family)
VTSITDESFGDLVRLPYLSAVCEVSGVSLSNSTKGGLNAATKSLAIEYAKRSILVNAVALGVIKSPMHPVEIYPQLEAIGQSYEIIPRRNFSSKQGAEPWNLQIQSLS